MEIAEAPRDILGTDLYNPWPKQNVFHTSYARFRLFGGAQGPGKSLALLWEAIFHCLKHAGSNSLLLRRTFPELDSGLIDHFEKHVLANPDAVLALLDGDRKRWNRSNRIVRFPNGSTLKFGYCEAVKDVYQYDSAEYVFIGFDELTQFPYRIWEHLRLRNRCPVPGSRPCMAGATNPGGANAEWVKSLWIDKKPFPGMESYQYDPSDYDFIPANVYDNPTYANDYEYIKNLQQMSPALRAQRLEGSWDTFEGQFFTNFEQPKGRHVIDTRLNPVTIPDWWPRWMAMDWGFAHHSAIGWYTHGDVTDEGGQNRKVVIKYRELTLEKHTAEQLAQHIAYLSGYLKEKWECPVCTEKERKPIFLQCRADQTVERITSFWLSPDAFAKKESVRTVAMQLGDALRMHGMNGPSPADNDRVGGWNLMYQQFELDTFLIFDTCIQTIRALPMLMRDAPLKTEDVLKTDSLADDIGDETRYAIKSYLNPRKEPEELGWNRKYEAASQVGKGVLLYQRMLKQQERGRAQKPRFMVNSRTV
jgi:hypothetical protein